jgi:hypothetical protein
MSTKIFKYTPLKNIDDLGRDDRQTLAVFDSGSYHSAEDAAKDGALTLVGNEMSFREEVYCFMDGFEAACKCSGITTLQVVIVEEVKKMMFHQKLIAISNYRSVSEDPDQPWLYLYQGSDISFDSKEDAEIDLANHISEYIISENKIIRSDWDALSDNAKLIIANITYAEHNPNPIM